MSYRIRAAFAATCILVCCFAAGAARAQWVADGNIVCDATGDQAAPEIVTDGSGGALVVWWDYRNVDTDIFMQRIDVGGARVWTSGGLPVCVEANNQTNPSIAADLDGGAFLSWLDGRAGTSSKSIYVQRVDAAGGIQWLANGRWINSGAGASAILADGTGGAFLAWDEAVTYPTSIAVQRLDASGYRLWADYTIAGTGYQPRLVLDGAGGVVGGWQRWYATGYDNFVRGQRLDGDGALLWADASVSPGYYCEFDAQLVSDGTGGAIWVYVQGDGVFAQRVDGTGAKPWGTAGVEVFPTHGTAASARAVSDGAGGALVVADVDSGDIYVNRILAGGSLAWSATGVPIGTLTPHQMDPEIASDGSGGAFLVWADMRDYATTGADIYAQRVDAAGAAQWTADGVPICTAPGLQSLPRITATGDHSAIVTWNDDRNALTTGRDIYAQAIHADGSIGDPPIAVTAVSPYPGAGAAPVDADITVTFNAAAAAGTDWDHLVYVYGQLTGVHAFVAGYDAATRTVTITPGLAFAPGEVVSVSLIGGIQGANGSDLQPYTWGFTAEAQGADGGFAAPVSFPVGSQPGGICAADLDGDGAMDIAVANLADNTVSVLLGAGDGTFAAQTAYATGTGPNTIIAADVDRDGALDLVTTDPASNEVSVLRNTGAGAFAAPVLYAAGTNPQQTCAADFDCDGFLDLATANNASSGFSISLLFNQGDGTFAPAVNRDGGIYLWGVASGDLNGDGFPDLVCGSTTATDRISVLLNLGDGSFGPKTDTDPGGTVRYVQCADLDGDGDLDLAASGGGGLGGSNVWVLFNGGGGTFGPSVRYTGRGCATDDVDGDGDLDLVYPGYDGVTVRLNDGSGAFGDEASYPTGFGPVFLCAADFDGDGALDAASSFRGGDLVAVQSNHLSLSGVGGDGVPAATRLERAMPNPFNPSTRIVYALDRDCRVRLSVYDARGIRVATLVDEQQDAREHVVVWDGRDGAGRRVASGVYFCRLRAGKRLDTMKMTLLK